jgi:hypothetical protein
MKLDKATLLEVTSKLNGLLMFDEVNNRAVIITGPDTLPGAIEAVMTATEQLIMANLKATMEASAQTDSEFDRMMGGNE